MYSKGIMWNGDLVIPVLMVLSLMAFGVAVIGIALYFLRDDN